MVKVVSCKETGRNCEFIIRGDTEDDLLANATQHGADAHRIGAQEDEAIRTFGQDFVTLSGLGEAVLAERANWLKKVKDVIREE